MVKKAQAKKTGKEKDLEELRKEIAQKGNEIEQLQKCVEEMKIQIKEKEKTGETADLNRMVGDVSGLLNVGFGIFGASDKAQGEKSRGLLGLVNELGKLAEKSQTTQKTINLGKGGVIDFRVSSHPIRNCQASKPASTLKISKPNKALSKARAPFPSTVGTINEKQPIVDVFEEGECLRVMAEMPGIEEKEINLKVEGNALTISAGASGRKYFKKVELPSPVEKLIIESSCRNGILEAKLKKTKNGSASR